MNSSILVSIRSSRSRPGAIAGERIALPLLQSARTVRPSMNVAELIERDRVHGSLYTDPSVYDAELERVWSRTAVFIGHEREVPEPTDYFAKTIGPQQRT